MSSFDLDAKVACPIPEKYWLRFPLDIAFIKRDPVMLTGLVCYVLRDPSVFPATFGKLLYHKRSAFTVIHGQRDLSEKSAAKKGLLEKEIYSLKEQII